MEEEGGGGGCYLGLPAEIIKTSTPSSFNQTVYIISVGLLHTYTIDCGEQSNSQLGRCILVPVHSWLLGVSVPAGSASYPMLHGQAA